MDDDQFVKLMSKMNEIKNSQRDTDNKLREFRKEVSGVQEKTKKELSQKIAKSGYTFQRKGHEHQYNFNTGVQENIASARNELVKLTSNPSNKDALARVDACLDEGAKALHTRQKHIMIADSSDWGAVRHYEADPLADDSDDEKRIKRAKKASKKEADAASYPRKHRGGPQGGGGIYRKKCPQWVDQSGSSFRRDVYQLPPLMVMGPQYQQRFPVGQFQL